MSLGIKFDGECACVRLVGEAVREGLLRAAEWKPRQARQAETLGPDPARAASTAHEGGPVAGVTGNESEEWRPHEALQTQEWEASGEFQTTTQMESSSNLLLAMM